MKTKLIREYFISKFEAKYKTPYLSKSSMADMSMLNRLLSKYGEPLVLSAIDLFIKSTPKDKASINYFSTEAFFSERFETLIKLRKIIPYIKKLSSYSSPLYDKIKALIDEYTDYAVAVFPTTSELIRKKEIEKELEDIDAKRFRGEIIECGINKC